MSDEKDRQLRVPFAHEPEHRLEVVQVVREPPHVTADSRGPPVALLVVGVDDAAPSREPGADVLVTAAVLGEAVNQQQDALGIRRQPLPAKKAIPAGSRDLGFRPTDGRSLHAP